MVQILLIGIGAGAASALLFAVGRLRLAVLDLPVLSRAAADPDRGDRLEPLGRAGRGVFAAAGLAFVFGIFFFVAFLIGVGLPAWWLGYLALLGAARSGNGDSLEWYPAGTSGGVGRAASARWSWWPRFRISAPTKRASARRCAAASSASCACRCARPPNAPLELPGRADINRVVDVLLVW